MEKEENRGLINKNAYEDQWAKAWSIEFWSSPIILSLSLSHSWTLRVSWSPLAWSVKGISPLGLWVRTPTKQE